MATGSLSPVGIQQFFDANGDPLAGGKLYFYQAGTDIPTPAYADVTLLTQLANPVVLDAAGRAPELFLAALAYKQVLKTAQDVTIWTADNILSQDALRDTSIIINITGTGNNIPVPPGIITFVQCANTAPLTITGFSGGSPGQVLIVRASDTAPVYLAHYDTVNSPGNQLYNFVSSGPTPLAGGHGVAVYVKAQGSWMLVSHEQGGSLRIPYAVGNFDAQGGTWTVEAADVVQQDYVLRGGNLLVTIAVKDTTLAGAPTLMRVGGWPYKWRTGSGYLPDIFGDGLGYKGGLAAVLANDSSVYFGNVTFTALTAGPAAAYLQAMIDVS